MKLIDQAELIINEYCDNLADPFLSKVHRLLLEADVQWLNLQLFAIGQILRNPQVYTFGQEHIENWDDLNNNQKISKLFVYFNESGALKDIRDYVESSPDISSTKSSMHYDFHEIDEPFNGNESVHLEQLKNSKAFKDLVQILLNHL